MPTFSTASTAEPPPSYAEEFAMAAESPRPPTAPLYPTGMVLANPFESRPIAPLYPQLPPVAFAPQPTAPPLPIDVGANHRYVVSSTAAFQPPPPPSVFTSACCCPKCPPPVRPFASTAAFHPTVQQVIQPAPPGMTAVYCCTSGCRKCRRIQRKLVRHARRAH
ncbi:hypothetical protein M3Y99_01041500 [Aphelenchoides fujianensis]|nr:hypothetical protein M3Y99_01041500 [Aphelenchoides fujianensis]